MSDIDDDACDRLMALFSELVARRHYVLLVACLRFWHAFRGLEDYMERQEDEPDVYLMQILAQALQQENASMEPVMAALIAAPVFHLRVRASEGERHYWNPTQESFRAFTRRYHQITVAEDWTAYPAAQDIQAWLNRWTVPDV